MLSLAFTIKELWCIVLEGSNDRGPVDDESVHSLLKHIGQCFSGIAEISYDQFSFGTYQQIFRLDVPVHHTHAVKIFKS